MYDMRDTDKLVEWICEGASDICGKDCKMPRNQFCAYCHSIANYLLSKGVKVNGEENGR